MLKILTGQLPAKRNYKCGRTEDIKYIVIHYTANLGDTAQNNVRYFHNNTVMSSAHYFVDEKCAITSVPEEDTAYHCGGKLQGKDGHTHYGKCTNQNSIGVELCLQDKLGRIRQGTVERAVELVRYLMNRYGITEAFVIRHFDVTGKACPKPFLCEAVWSDFLKKLEGYTGLDEITRINSVLTLVGKDIEGIRNRLSAIEAENARQNEIINLVGADIEYLKVRGQESGQNI